MIDRTHNRMLASRRGEPVAEDIGVRTKQIFQYIASFKAEHDGHNPSMRQIAQACGLSQPGSALEQVRKLHRLGYIDYHPVEPSHHSMDILKDEDGKLLAEVPA